MDANMIVTKRRGYRLSVRTRRHSDDRGEMVPTNR
jgi:hypothetical protein